MDFELKPLPYAYDALAPHLSAETLHLHHDKHHAGYLRKLFELIGSRPEAGEPLEALVRTAQGPVFENAAQVWNHDFLWASMSPRGGGEPNGALATMLRRDFGTVSAFRKAFISKAGAHFGSGWVWLVVNEAGHLDVSTTHDADLPLLHGEVPLLTADLWEHAYYVDYRNDRHAYLEAFIDHLIHWDFAARNFASAMEARGRE